MPVFMATAVNIFGIENGGQLFAIMDWTIPLTGLASMSMALLDINSEMIIYIGGVLTVINFILMWFFDDTPIA